MQARKGAARKSGARRRRGVTGQQAGRSSRAGGWRDEHQTPDHEVTGTRAEESHTVREVNGREPGRSSPEHNDTEWEDRGGARQMEPESGTKKQNQKAERGYGGSEGQA